MENYKNKYRWLVLGLVFFNIFFCALAVNGVPPLFSEIIKEIPLTKAQMGTVVGVFTLASLFFAPIGGGLSDKLGPRWIFGGAAVLVFIAGGLRYYVGSVGDLIACMFFIGGGIAIFQSVMPKALRSWFPPQELAKAIGIAMSSLGLGGAVAMATAEKLLSPTFGGWRGTMVAIAASSLVFGVLWLLFYKEGKEIIGAGHQEENIWDNFKKVFKVKDVWLIAFFYGLLMVDAMGITAFLPVTLEEKGISNPGKFVAIFFITAFIFNIVGGAISDKVGKRKPFLVISGILFGICIPAFITFTGAPLAISLMLAGGALGTAIPILMTVPIEIKQIGHALGGTAVGLIIMIGNTGGFIGPVIAGMMMDIAKSPWPAFLLMAAAAIVAALVVLPLQETGRKKEG